MIRWVRLKNGVIILHTLFSRTDIPLKDLQAIFYHYHAVVGYVFLWEFCGKNEKTIEVNGLTLGRSCLLMNLETQLPGFSMKKFKKLFKEGDVVDTLEIWKRENPN